MERLSVIVPCYNEAILLEKSTAIIRDKLNSLMSSGKISSDSFILLVDDGSTDSTWEIIAQMCSGDMNVAGLKLSCNNGHQNAIMAGLQFVSDKCDACISIDADMQDDINTIDIMVDKFHEGYDIIYGVRNSRKTDNFLKRWTAAFFYWCMSLLGTKTIPNHADFRLMSKKALVALLSYRERNIFLRGIIPSMGFRNCCVYYERQRRIAGKSKFSLSKMINLALSGVTSFSTKPLRMIFIIGLISFLISIASFVYVLWSYLGGGSVKGWTSLIGSIWFLGSIIIMSIGIIGEYIGRIYSEVKNRPPYNVDMVIYEEKTL